MDLTQFHQAFYEESAEAIAQMEQALLRLDAGRPEPELINTIFRVAHSIKGGAATFGFDEIASFTHSLETLLDELRGARLEVTAALSELLLRSVDVLREMLRSQQASQPLDAQRVADLQFDIELTLARSSEPPPQARSAPASPARTGPCYQIDFRPLPQLLARGNDPLRIFAELRELGELEVRLDSSMLPPLEQLDPASCHLGWTLLLWTPSPQPLIAAAFDWAAGDCQLEIRLLEAPALSAAKPVAASPVAASPVAAGASPGDAGSIRVSVDKIDELMGSVGELIITRSMLAEYGALIEGPLGERMRDALARLERNLRGLQDSVLRVRMLPVSCVFSRFPRMVRDLALRRGKQVELRLRGENTELDKTVLERIGDPLMHLVRNCIDHGIESPQQRSAAGKSACGTVQLQACHQGSSIRIEVSDDGAGLQRDRILAKARERGLIGADEQLGYEAVGNLIFLPGFSTNDEADEVSGRGVGMDVVKRNVEALAGSIEVHSECGRGTRFIITLPLTLAIIEGQSVAIGGECYIVPLAAIIESVQLRETVHEPVIGHGELLRFRGEYLPILELQQLFGAVGLRPRTTEAATIMVVEGDGRRFGLRVDALLGQQQCVVKTLEANYHPVEGIAGATILGDGAIALILDIASLARRLSAHGNAIAA